MSDSPVVPRPVAIVVGGGSGLGAAVVNRLAARGWAVAIHAHASFAAARAVAEALVNRGVPALAVTADLREEGPVRALVHRVADHFGRIDAVVHCARLGREIPLGDLTADDLRAAIDVGLVGMVVLAQEAGAAMAGQATGGTIVLVSAGGEPTPQSGRLAAAIVAAAIPATARALAVELAASGVRVQAVETTANAPVDEAAAAVTDALVVVAGP